MASLYERALNNNKSHEESCQRVYKEFKKNVQKILETDGHALTNSILKTSMSEQKSFRASLDNTDLNLAKISSDLSFIKSKGCNVNDLNKVLVKNLDDKDFNYYIDRNTQDSLIIEW
jgi:hypothetical protein